MKPEIFESRTALSADQVYSPNHEMENTCTVEINRRDKYFCEPQFREGNK